MYIENEKLVELLLAEKEIDDKIADSKSKVEELIKSAGEIKEAIEPELKQKEQLRQEMVKIFVPYAIENTSEKEVFEFVKLQEGKAFIPVSDITENIEKEALEQVAKIKEDWSKFIEKINKFDEVVK